MKYLYIKDRKRRILYNLFEKKIKVLKALYHNLNMPLRYRYFLYVQLLSLPKDCSIVRLRNRCALTNRPRGVYKVFGISRLMFRKYI
jgi:small subunit ribosomal protein S14